MLKKNYKLSDTIARRANGLKKSLVSGCTDVRSCKQLAEYLSDARNSLQSEISELQKLFAQSTGNGNVDAFYKALLDSSETPKYIKDFLNDTGLKNFVLNNATVPDFGGIVGGILPKFGWQDLTKILKSNIPDDLKPLQKIATADDWKVVTAQARELLGKRKAFFVDKYEDLLYTAERVAPDLVEKIRGGATPHITTLKKAGVDKQTATDIVDYYRAIKEIESALK